MAPPGRGPRNADAFRFDSAPPLPLNVPAKRLFALVATTTPVKTFEALNVLFAPNCGTTATSMAMVPDVVIGPPVRPAPVFTAVTVPPELLSALQIGCPPEIFNTCPFAPGANGLHAPVPLVRSSEPVGVADVSIPVPPRAGASTPDTISPAE